MVPHYSVADVVIVLALELRVSIEFLATVQPSQADIYGHTS